MRKHWEDTFSKVDYVQTFTKMHDAWEAHLENKSMGEEGADTSKENIGGQTGLPMTPPNAQWRKGEKRTISLKNSN